MIWGIGTDICDIRRFDGQKTDLDDPFINRVYTCKEWEQGKERSDIKSFMATRFAAKEACFKALRADGNDVRVRLNDIEILSDEKDRPFVILHGFLKEYAEENGIAKVHVSISFEKDHALAFAVSETK